MLTEINPKLPMRDKEITRDFYVNKLGFKDIGVDNFKDYLMVQKDHVQIHFFYSKHSIRKKTTDKFISVQMI
ncbi:hypothetical protein [Pedobacter sp. P26]|uniref:hypothetical protein n=1 Tax=Pedobacter sp. P26 TaxID=3423956 RepID=UPI003D671189